MIADPPSMIAGVKISTLRKAVRAVVAEQGGAATMKTVRDACVQRLGLQSGSLHSDPETKARFKLVVLEIEHGDHSSGDDGDNSGTDGHESTSDDGDSDSEDAGDDHSEASIASDEDSPVKTKKRRAVAEPTKCAKKRRPVAAVAPKPVDTARIVAMKAMASAVSLGPSFHKGLAAIEDADERADEMASRLRAKGLSIAGDTPSKQEISAARQAKEKERDLDGMDASLILDGGGRGGRSRRGSSEAGGRATAPQPAAGSEDDEDDEDDEDHFELGDSESD
jgi:hypothetical protein